MKKEPILIIMAAGLGSRFGGLKQIKPVTEEGEIILDFAVYDAWKAGFRKIVFVIKKEMEKDFREMVMEPIRPYLDAVCVVQDMADLPAGYSLPQGRVKPWGTCHAVLTAKNLIEGPFAVINADDYYGRDAFFKVREFLLADRDENEYCMAGYNIENTLSEQGKVTRGICRTDDCGNLLSIRETKNIGWQEDNAIASVQGGELHKICSGTTVSMNFWGFQHSMIRHIEEGFPEFLQEASAEDPMEAEYLLPTRVGALLKQRAVTVRVLDVEDQWYGVTYREDLPKARDAFRIMKNRGWYPEKLFTIRE